MIAALSVAAAAIDTRVLIQDHVLASVAGRVPLVGRLFSPPEELVGKIRFSQAKTVAIVIHGGLVSAESAVETAKVVHPIFPKGVYPIYVAWETGPGYSLFPPQASRSGWRTTPEHHSSDPKAAYPLGPGERRLERSTRGLAKTMWRQMKRFAAAANDPADGDATMNRFMRALVPLWKERGLRVLLIAHSAGANFTLRSIEAMPQWYAGAKVEVVFLAPACTYSSFQGYAPLWRRQVRSFRMFALTDAAERLDALLAVGAVPKRIRGWYEASMLYYVSNNLESYIDTPLLGMQRFWKLHRGLPVPIPRALSEDENRTISLVDTTLGLARNAVWAGEPSRGPGWECGAVSHIGFWTDPGTRRSLATIAASPMNP